MPLAMCGKTPQVCAGVMPVGHLQLLLLVVTVLSLHLQLLLHQLLYPLLHQLLPLLK